MYINISQHRKLWNKWQMRQTQKKNDVCKTVEMHFQRKEKQTKQKHMKHTTLSDILFLLLF